MIKLLNETHWAYRKRIDDIGPFFILYKEKCVEHPFL
jgi:hypothetical protein